MEVVVADDRVKGREILGEALEQPEEVHPSVDAHALVAADKVARDSLTLGDQTPEDSLWVVESWSSSRMRRARSASAATSEARGCIVVALDQRGARPETAHRFGVEFPHRIDDRTI